MSSRKHPSLSSVPQTPGTDGYQGYTLKDKDKDTHVASVVKPHFKYGLYLFFFLTIWFLLLFFWFPSTKPAVSPPIIQNSNSHVQNLPAEKVQMKLEEKVQVKPAEKAQVKPVEKAQVKPAEKESVLVYVYELPPKFNIGLLKECRRLNVYTDMCPHVANCGLGQPILEMGSSWFATHQFIAEMIFHARMENHPCRTRDPEKADLFYVPFYGGLHASSKFRESNVAARDALAVELVEYIHRQRWWRRNHGADHFLALGRTAWDFMRTDGGTDFGANRLLNLPPVKNMSVLTVERHPWEGSNQYGIPYPSYFHPSTSDEILTWQNRMRLQRRLHLFSFIGAPRNGVDKAAIRDEIIKQCAESTRCHLLKCGSGASQCHEPTQVLNVMTQSEFCLQAPGDSFTRRSTFDSFLAGCIPVFVSPHTAYSQYSWFLPADHTTYSVFIGDENPSIEAELLKIPNDQIQKMRNRVINLIPNLTYIHPNSSDFGFTDAVDVALGKLSDYVKSKLRGHGVTVH
ncbi:hypothetical protein AAG906_030197 [Vitis piasezkii]